MASPILIIEDDRIDAMSAKIAIKSINDAKELVLQNDGQEAMTWLNDSRNDTPSIILLDLSMPKMNGLEFLGKIKKTEHLKRVPVVVLTSSNNIRDKNDCFDAGASGYFVKPLDYDKYIEMLKTVFLYWSYSELGEY